MIKVSNKSVNDWLIKNGVKFLCGVLRPQSDELIVIKF